MSYRIETIVEEVLWLGAAVAALVLFLALVVLERVDAIAEWAQAAGGGRPGAAPHRSPILH